MRLLLILLSLMCLASGVRAVEGEDLDRLIGSLILVGFRGQDTNAPDVKRVLADAKSGRIGGVILFDYDVALKAPGRNIANPAQVKALNAAIREAAGRPFVIAVDQEGGRVDRLKARYGFPPTKSAAEIGQTAGSGGHNTKSAAAAGEGIGRTLKEAGFNLNFAPVVDVDRNPDNPVIGKIGRSFSDDPNTVTRLAGAFLQGMTDRRVVGCLKHFPGHGSSTGDSHLGVTDVTNTWNEIELVPFESLIRQGWDGPIMTAHIFNAKLDPEHPATLSKKTATDLLRGKLGFRGALISDDLQMWAITDRYGLDKTVELALNAGVDMLTFGNNLVFDPDAATKVIDIVKKKIASGAIPLSRIKEAHARVSRLAAGLE